MANREGGGGPSPLWPKFIHFHVVFGKIGQIVAWRLLGRVVAPFWEILNPPLTDLKVKYFKVPPGFFLAICSGRWRGPQALRESEADPVEETGGLGGCVG